MCVGTYTHEPRLCVSGAAVRPKTLRRLLYNILNSVYIRHSSVYVCGHGGDSEKYILQINVRETDKADDHSVCSQPKGWQVNENNYLDLIKSNRR